MLSTEFVPSIGAAGDSATIGWVENKRRLVVRSIPMERMPAMGDWMVLSFVLKIRDKDTSL
jgi:hypothetical protein